MDRVNKKIVPWMNSFEFEAVYNGLFHGSIKDQKYAIERINVWKSRITLPIAVESTCAFFNVVVNHDKNNTDSLRNAYSLAIIRFVNHITEKGQVKVLMQPIHKLARELGLPEWIVKLRHEATHRILPSLDVLKTGADFCIQWLKEQYWDKQLAGMTCGQMMHRSNGTSEIHDLLTKYKKLKRQDPKRTYWKLSKVLDEIEMETVCNRKMAASVLAEHLKGSMKHQDILYWDGVLKIVVRSGLSLSVLKQIPLAEENHSIISSILYQTSDTGQEDKVVQYFDFIFNFPDQQSVINLLQILDLHRVLPQHKASQLERLIDIHLSDQICSTERIYCVNDLKKNEEMLAGNTTVNSSWKICNDPIDWGQYPIGSIPDGDITYTNLLLGNQEDIITTESQWRKFVGTTMNLNKHEEEERKVWSKQDIDTIQGLIKIL